MQVRTRARQRIARVGAYYAGRDDDSMSRHSAWQATPTHLPPCPGALLLDANFLPRSAGSEVDCTALGLTALLAAGLLGGGMLMFKKSIYVFAGILGGEIVGGARGRERRPARSHGGNSGSA